MCGRCWCGDQDDFTEYGTGQCNSACTDTSTTNAACGGVVSFSLYQIYGDGGVDADAVADDQGDDDGGLGADERESKTLYTIR